MESEINSCDLICTKCGHREEREHTLTETTKESACTEEGYRKTVCTECGYTEREEILSPNGHTFDEETACGEYTCTSCGAQKTIPHEYISEIYPATCMEEGYTLRECIHCGDTYKTDITEKGDHTYDNYGICECGRISGEYYNFTATGEWRQTGEAKTAVISFYETEIPVMAFYGNTDIEEVYCGAYMATICDYAFDGCTSLKRIYVPVTCNISSTALPQGVKVIRVEYD